MRNPPPLSVRLYITLYTLASPVHDPPSLVTGLFEILASGSRSVVTLQELPYAPQPDPRIYENSPNTLHRFRKTPLHTHKRAAHFGNILMQYVVFQATTVTQAEEHHIL